MEHKDKKVIKIKRAEHPTIPDRDEKFVKMPFAIIEEQEYREKNQCPLMLLMYIARYVVRGDMKDKLNLYNDYYKNNWLASSMTQAQMARAFKVSRMTISRWVNTLVKDECLRIEKILIDGYKKRNVYIVGTHNNYDACLFIEEVYTKT